MWPVDHVEPAPSGTAQTPNRRARAVTPPPPREPCEWCGREMSPSTITEVLESSGVVARGCVPCAQQEEVAQERAAELEWAATSFDEVRVPWEAFR